jgi:carbonic anhydrase/acetyltransferase-like protein (isoleucine patch superfamily)
VSPLLVRSLLKLFIVVLPWRLKRFLLRSLYGYDLHPASHIGLAWVFPTRLVMGQHSSVGHLTVCKGLDLLAVGEHSTIGRLNWISAYPLNRPPHFAHMTNRKPQLVIGEHAAITHRHIIDCTDEVVVGAFATVAGFRSQILTHSIDLKECRQHAKPVRIGRYSFVGTACTILGGAVVPDYSVVAANALLNKAHEERYRLYAGVPAKAVAQLDPDMQYFSRGTGFVV